MLVFARDHFLRRKALLGHILQEVFTTVGCLHVISARCAKRFSAVLNRKFRTPSRSPLLPPSVSLNSYFYSVFLSSLLIQFPILVSNNVLKCRFVLDLFSRHDEAGQSVTTGEDHSSGVDIRSRESSAFDPPSYEISYASDHTLKWDPPQGSMELSIALSYHFPIERDLECKMRAATRKFLKAEARKKPLNWNSVLQRTKAAIVRAGQGPRSPKEMASTYPSGPNPRQQFVTSELELGQNARNESSRETPPEPRSLHSNANPVENTRRPGRSKSSTHPSDVDLGPPSSELPLKIVPWDSGSGGFLKRRTKRRYGMEERTKVAANRGNACPDHQRKKLRVGLQFHISSLLLTRYSVTPRLVLKTSRT